MENVKRLVYMVFDGKNHTKRILNLKIATCSTKSNFWDLLFCKLKYAWFWVLLGNEILCKIFPEIKGGVCKRLPKWYEIADLKRSIGKTARFLHIIFFLPKPLIFDLFDQKNYIVFLEKRFCFPNDASYTSYVYLFIHV